MHGCSNVKSDKQLVVVKADGQRMETGRKKFGAVLGDLVEVGCGSVLNPGTVIGRDTEECPARAAFAVKSLPMGALVEIETIAAK